MPLTIVGIGFKGNESISLKGFEHIKKTKNYYINVNVLPKNVTAVRIEEDQLLKKNSQIYIDSQTENVSLITEDIFWHNIFAKIKIISQELGLYINTIHNSSVINLAGCTGIHLYNMGVILSLNVTSASDVADKILKCISMDLHSCVLLDSAESSTILTDIFTRISDKKHKLYISVDSENNVSYNESELPHINGESRAVIICSKLHPCEDEALKKLSNLNNNKANTLHLIGLGLGSPSDVTIAGELAIKKSKKVYLETYTSVMVGGKDQIEGYFNKKVLEADRDTVEGATAILNDLQDGDVSMLVVGDPLAATTHTDVIIRAIDLDFNVNIVNNASIINAAWVCGLNPTSFGQIVSIPFWTDSWKPQSFYDKIVINMKSEQNTLCLLDIKVKELSMESLMKGKKEYEPARFMTVNQAASQLLDIIEGKDDSLLQKDSKVMGLARVGTSTELIKECRLDQVQDVDFGGPLHCMIICHS